MSPNLFWWRNKFIYILDGLRMSTFSLSELFLQKQHFCSWCFYDLKKLSCILSVDVKGSLWNHWFRTISFMKLNFICTRITENLTFKFNCQIWMENQIIHSGCNIPPLLLVLVYFTWISSMVKLVFLVFSGTRADYYTSSRLLWETSERAATHVNNRVFITTSPTDRIDWTQISAITNVFHISTADKLKCAWIFMPCETV